MTPARWRWNALILVWLGFYLFLGVRSLVVDDARYGWGMFSKQVDYRIDYFWLTDDGGRSPMPARDDLKGEARRILEGGRDHRTRYGAGMVRHAVRSYLRHRTAAGPPDAVAAVARITYAINHSEDLHVEELVHPAKRAR